MTGRDARALCRCIPLYPQSQPRGQSPLMLTAIPIRWTRSPSQDARTVHVRYRDASWLGFALAASMLLPARSAQGGVEPVSVTTPFERATPTAVPAEERPSSPSTGKPSRNDLEKGPCCSLIEGGRRAGHRQVFVTKPYPTVVSGRCPTPEAVYGRTSTKHHWVRRAGRSEGLSVARYGLSRRLRCYWALGLAGSPR
jgi:hypothetical protein